METVVDFSADRRRRGNQSGLYTIGHGTVVEGNKAVSGLHKHLTRKQRSPQEEAGIRLTKALGAYSETSVELRTRWKDELLGMPQLRTMNMDILAAALVLLLKVNAEVDPENLTPENFEATVDSVLTKLVTDDVIIMQKHRESVFRYIRAVIDYRDRRKRELESIRERYETVEEEIETT